MTTSFWEKAALSLPPQVRDRYAAQLEAAERVERLLDSVIEVWDSTTRTLAKGYRKTSHSVHWAGRHFQAPARRVWLMRSLMGTSTGSNWSPLRYRPSRRRDPHARLPRESEHRRRGKHTFCRSAV
ncbi:MAG: hypothetical protein HY661_13235 [Betaproteobacteria bacterium]|nr:hypothetical protein [Betaproteobacteria bacterium]